MASLLVIDDNDFNLELITYLLRAAGHEIATAKDGARGLERAAAGGIDLIICDAHLPRVDGWAVARQVKADPVLREIPIIVATALARAGDKEELLSSGFDGYIAKPIDVSSFVAEVESYLNAVK